MSSDARSSRHSFHEERHCISWLEKYFSESNIQPRFLSSVGYVAFNNLVGKARIIFFSNDKKKGNFFKFWKWHKSIRTDRFFNKIK